MLKHSPEKPNKMRFSLLKTSDKRSVDGCIFNNQTLYDSFHHDRYTIQSLLHRFKTDGLTSLEYKLVGTKLEPLFTEIDVALMRTTGDARGHLHSFHRKI